MQKIKRLAVLTSMILLYSEVADSCSCIPQSLLQRVHDSDLVFRGKVLNRLPVQVNMMGMEIDGESISFQIEHVYKGKAEMQYVRIGVVYGESACGYHFKSGQSYMVFANRSSRNLKAPINPFTYSHYSSLCHGNQAFSVTREVEILQTMKTPFIWQQ